MFKTSILGSSVIVSTDPEVNKVILQNQGNIFVPAYPKSIRELMGEHSILQMNGNIHKKMHSLIACFLKSPQLKARITSDIEHSVKQCLASWTHKTIYIQDEVKKVSLFFLINFSQFFYHLINQMILYITNFYYITCQITFTILIKVLMSVGPGEDLELLKREFGEFIKGLICLPIKFPGTRLYKSLKVTQTKYIFSIYTLYEYLANIPMKYK